MAVLRRLRDAGHIAYFAGGCVRDLLLGLEPKDYDVATDAPPMRIRELFSRTQSVGAAFGVILVHHGQSVVEVATFRTDLKYADGRRPEGVQFSSPEDDARRRDFTINGLFLDPINNQIIDFVGGQDDLQAGRLRAIGNAQHRFEEDHLRLLRAVRFAARFGLKIDQDTAAAMFKNGPLLIRISPERIADELRMMLTSASREIAWKLLWQFDLLRVVLRDLPEKPAGEKDFNSLFAHLSSGEAIPFGLALAGLVLDYRMSAGESALALLDKRQAQRSVRACRKDLKISNEEAEMMFDCLHLCDLFGDPPPSVAAMKRFLAGPHSRQARAILNALGAIDGQLRPQIQRLAVQFGELLKSDVAPLPLITGEDLIAMGMSPGPLFKKVLHAVYDAQLENRIGTKSEAMSMAKDLAR